MLSKRGPANVKLDSDVFHVIGSVKGEAVQTIPDAMLSKRGPAPVHRCTKLDSDVFHVIGSVKGVAVHGTLKTDKVSRSQPPVIASLVMLAGPVARKCG